MTRACDARHACVQVGKFFGLGDEDVPAFAIHDQVGDGAAAGKYISKNVKAGSVSKYIKDFLVSAALAQSSLYALLLC